MGGARWQVLVGVAALISLSACDGGGASTQTGAAQLYEVTTFVMQAPSGPVIACAGMVLPDPPIGCGGATLHGLDLASMQGAVHYRNGVLASGGYLRMTGTWDGQALWLTRSPIPASAADATQLPSCRAGETGDGTPFLAAEQEIGKDMSVLQARGIEVLVTGGCGNQLFIGLVVADPAAVAFLESRYGAAEIAGWLQPAGGRA